MLTSNMHQSWPKYVQNLWYATADGGVAALLYAPSEVNLTVGEDTNLKIVEETGYPFRNQVRFTLSPSQTVTFPFHLRIPAWANNPAITINGKPWQGEVSNQTAIINRAWKAGDQVILTLPMEVKTSQWYDFAVAVERGPLVYALKIGEEAKTRQDEEYGTYQEIYPKDAWNYALHEGDLKNLTTAVEVVEKEWDGQYPWNLENAPIELRMRGVPLPDWKLVNSTPVFPAWWGNRHDKEITFRDITLVPYGCTTLRITEFPVYGLH